MKSLRISFLVFAMHLSMGAEAFPLSTIFFKSDASYVKGLSLRLLDWLKTEASESRHLLEDSRLRTCISDLKQWDHRIDDLNAMPLIWFRVKSVEEKVRVVEVGCNRLVFSLQGDKVLVEAIEPVEMSALKWSTELKEGDILGPAYLQGKRLLHVFLKLPGTDGKEAEFLSRRMVLRPTEPIALLEVPLQFNLFNLDTALRSFSFRYSHEFGLGIRTLYTDLSEGSREIIIP